MKRKVVIVGAGAVGATFAYALAQDGSAEEIVLVDKQQDLAKGQALDLAHGLSFVPSVVIHAGDETDYQDAQMIVVTAGSQQKSGESRLDLLQRNAKIMEQIITEIVQQNSEAVLVIVANPVDVLTRVALDCSGWPRERIFGSGTVLDSSRFRYLLSRHCGVNPHNVHGYVLGEHGDSEMVPWSLTHIAGVPMEEYCVLCGQCADWQRIREDLVETVRKSAYHIIDYKGATNFAIGLALVSIVRAVLRNQHSILTVSVQLDGEYSLNGVCLSVPCLVSERGIERIVEGKLTDDELQRLKHSADVLNESWESLGK